MVRLYLVSVDLFCLYDVEIPLPSGSDGEAKSSRGLYSQIKIQINWLSQFYFYHVKT